MPNTSIDPYDVDTQLADPAAHERQPPQDMNAECSVLGGMMLSKDAVQDVIDELTSGDDFYRPAHKAIFDAIVDLFGRGEPADPITVAAELERRGELGRIGGAPYLHTLIEFVPTAANAGYYAEIVAEKAQLRRFVEVGTRIVQTGYRAAGTNGFQVAELADQVQGWVHTATDRRGAATTKLAADRLEETLAGMERASGPRGVLSGFADLDEVTGGLRPGQLVIVAARPGMGKSTLAVDWLRHCSIKNKLASVLFSLEMTAIEVNERLISATGKVRLSSIRNQTLSDADWANIGRAAGEIAEAPLYVDDMPNMTITDIRSKARRLKQQKDLKLVVIDYLQLLTSGKRYESRQVEVAEYSRALKQLAQELEVPVVAVCQLNRNVESRADKKPMLSDLRESGSLEQDADLVLFIDRPDFWEHDTPRAGEADLSLAKHRGGPTRNLVVGHQLHYSRFVDLAAAPPTNGEHTYV